MQHNLAALVGSRICHDLISPIGAISNGVELLSLTEGDMTAEMQLISESVDAANARIRFFRIAFGGAGKDQMVSASEVLSILSAQARGGRFTYFWQVTDEPRRVDVRLAFLLMQCFESSLPLGGDITVESTGVGWTFTAVGRRINADEALWQSISDPQQDQLISAAQVHFALMREALVDAGRSLTFQIGDDRIFARI